jgi:TDG/mug DNA glycosylase family protein
VPIVWKPTKAEITAAYGKTIPDVIAPGLQILFCGINPSLYSAAIGHHFGRPGNRFWPTLFRAGFTERLLSPFEDRQLLDRGYGITNLVARATATADELTHKELIEGGRKLVRKLRRLAPACVAFLGITAYRVAFEMKRASIGKLGTKMAHSDVWILPNPSGLNVHYQLDDLALLFSGMRRSYT